MCIITETVEKVNATKIFTCFTEDESRQFLVYSNEVDTDSDTNCMVLPVPHPESVEFVNLSTYKRFFDDCEKNFKKRRAHDMLIGRAYAAASLERSVEPLPIHSVGSYLVSIVPTFYDFHRLDTREFKLSNDLATLLSTTYTSEFGFLVCKLKQGHHAYHPFAYLHRRHSGGLLFIPTLHYHPHGYGMAKEVKADWDHVIYSVGTDLDTTNYDGYDYIPTDAIKYAKLPKDVQWILRYKLKRWTKTGYGVNKDLWIAGNLRELLRPARPRTPSPTSQRQAAYEYEFPVTENGKKLLKKYFGV